MGVKAIVFDLDDTLYAERDYVASGMAAVDRFIRARYGTAGFREEATVLFESGVRDFIFNRTLEKLGIDHDAALIGELVDCYRSHRPAIRLLPDAVWALDRLADWALLGIITDGYVAAQRQKLFALGLTARCDAIVLTDTLGPGNWKPSPVPYETMAERLGLPHRECAYIGDNARKDFVTARRLGWTTVHIVRPGAVHGDTEVEPCCQADYRIGDLRELAAIGELGHLFQEEAELLHEQSS